MISAGTTTVALEAAASSPRAEVQVARSGREIRAIAAEWKRLQSTPASDLDYFLAALESRIDVRRPHVVLVRCDSAPVAVAAGRLEDISLSLKIGYRRIWSPQVRCLTLEPGAIVGDVSDATAHLVVRGLYEALGRREADLVLLHELRSDSPLHRAARIVPAAPCRDRRPNVNVRWMISFPESCDAPLALSPHTRKHLRYYANRLQRKYGDSLRVATFTEASQLERLMKDADTVGSKTYQRRLGVGFFDDERTRERIRFEMEQGWFRSWVLYVADAPRAFWMGLRYGDTYYSGDTGYDPDLRSDRIGEFLLSWKLEALRREKGLRRLDFGFGDADYKRRYATDHFEEVTIAMFAPTARGVVLNAVRALVGGANQLLKSAVTRLDLLEPVRSRARRRLVRAIDEARPRGGLRLARWATAGVAEEVPADPEGEP